jgi:hypothetical protein
MIVYVVAVPLIAHGLANLAGMFGPWTQSLQGFKNGSWSFSSHVALKSGAGRGFGVLWLLSSICLIAAGLGAIFHQSWWLRATLSGCALSLLAIASWWKAVPPGARFGAFFDLAVIALLVSPLGERISQAIQ